MNKIIDKTEKKTAFTNAEKQKRYRDKQKKNR